MKYIRSMQQKSQHRTNSSSQEALNDLAEGLRLWPLWGRLARQDIRYRYRRSTLGPFWITLTTAVLIFTIGFLYGRLFKIDLQTYFPFLTIGLLLWRLISDGIHQGCLAFIAAETMIKNNKFPLSTHVLHVTATQFFLFAHNIVVYVVVAVLFSVNPGGALLVVPIGLALICLNLLWMGLLLGVASVRFRDIPPIIESILQMTFFLTPIIWMPNSFSDRKWFIEWNPFYHFIEIVRAPLRGVYPSPTTWIMVIAITIIGWGLTFYVFQRWRSKVPYWL